MKTDCDFIIIKFHVLATTMLRKFLNCGNADFYDDTQQRRWAEVIYT